MFYLHPYLGKWSNLTNIFQLGWNHQLETLNSSPQLYLGILGYHIQKLNSWIHIQPYVIHGYIPIKSYYPPNKTLQRTVFESKGGFKHWFHVPKIGGIRSKFDESEYFLKWVDSTMVMLYHGIHHYHCPPCGRRLLVHFFQVVSKRGKSNETRQRKFRSQIKRIPHRKGLGASLIKRK